MDNTAYKPQEVPSGLPREPPPSYSTTVSPTGLDQLSTLTRVDIRQRNITTEHGVVIFGLKRELVRKGCSATFRFDLYDMTGTRVIRFKPVSGFCSPRLEVYVHGQYVAKLWKRTFGNEYWVGDANGVKVLKLYKPGFYQNQFLLRLKDLEGNQIGSITKKWTGLADEVFADSNVLEIDFPRALGVQYKATVIGICIVLIQEANIQYQYR